MLLPNRANFGFMTACLGPKALSPASGACFWDLMRISGSPFWCPFGRPLAALGRPLVALGRPLVAFGRPLVSRAPLASFSYKLHYINQKLWLNIHWTSIKHVCFPGRPDSRMYCPDIIGRDSWVWDEQKTLYKIIPPTGWGNKPSRQGLSTLRN